MNGHLLISFVPGKSLSRTDVLIKPTASIRMARSLWIMNYKSLLVRFLIAANGWSRTNYRTADINGSKQAERVFHSQHKSDENRHRKRSKVANNAVIFNVNEISGLITYARAAS